MRLLGILQDSHIQLRKFGKNISQDKFPFVVKHFANGYHIIQLELHLKQYIGYQLKAINNIPIEKVIKQLSKFLAHENSILLSNLIELWISHYDLLCHSNVITSKKTVLSLENSNGKIVKIPLQASSRQQAKLYNPLETLTNPDETLIPVGLYWTKYYEEINTFYMQYNECEDISKEEILKIIANITQIGPKYVVIDLRSNIGGSSLILDPLTKYLLKHQDKYNPVVFISNTTFSAAIINALNILDSKNAISMGTSTAGSPTKFGQAEQICTLPHSKMEISIATKYFKEKGFRYGAPLVPDVEVPITLESYLSQNDLVWDTFKRVIVKK